MYRIWRNKDTNQYFCAGKGMAHLSKRQLNQSYCTYKFFCNSILYLPQQPQITNRYDTSDV